MHILIISVLLLIAIYFFMNSVKRGGGAHKSRSLKVVAGGENKYDTSLDSFFYLSDGKLYQVEDGQSKQIESAYVRAIKEQTEKSKKLAGWKEGTTWDTSFAQMNGMGNRDGEGEIVFSSVEKVSNDRLLYFLKNDHFGGLFSYSFDDGRERRLLHQQNLDYSEFRYSQENEKLLFSAKQSGENANIALMDLEGNNYREVTGGDTIDTSPAWVLGEKNTFVYQSQGIARDPEGFIKGLSPAVIMMLNIESGELKTIFADENTDYLCPKVSRDGDLYFIRRPFESLFYSNTNALMDALMFPFRLLRAVFHYLNFFSLMYSRKPLTSAGGPKLDKDIKTVLIRGKRIEAEKALKKAQYVQGVPSLVPYNWQLVRCRSNGQQDVIATNVASYTISDNDEVIYTNGCGVFLIDPDGASVKMFQDKLVEDIAV